jgi:hypothetical protein
MEDRPLAVTIVTTANDRLHIFAGRLTKMDARFRAQQEGRYPHRTHYIAWYAEYDQNDPAGMAKRLTATAAKLREIVFK